MTLEEFTAVLRAPGRFERGSAVVVARAPGRLDVMGGIADYSGSLVLQRTIAEATFVALQRIDRPVLEIVSDGRTPVSIPMAALAPNGEPVSYATARATFAPGSDHHWPAYVAGVFLVLMRERGVTFEHGARIVIASSVPEGKGVSSSAAIETATMQAVSAAFDLRLEPHAMALLCQQAENLVAGAPCGVMDQMACTLGEADSLLALLCQPAEVQPPVRVPGDISLWGLDSGERHAVGGSDYGAVRAGAFMGHRILADAGFADRYLVNLSPSQLDARFGGCLPDEMSGEAFLARYGSTIDPITTIDTARSYKVRRPTEHPVREHHRVQTFRELLLAPSSEERRVRLGALMFESHASYSACGLGSRGTDLLVDLVREEGPAGGLYGARITGGGSGGTVAILGKPDASAAIDRVAGRYAEITGHRPHKFSGSSPGAAAFGSRSLIV